MARVFLSFVAQDAEAADELSKLLSERGHEVFRYVQDVAAGSRWAERLSQELRDAEACIILLSNSSARSQWVMHEAGMALGYSRERGQPVVLPVLLDDVKIPGPLMEIQALSAYDRPLSEVAENLSRVLQRQIGRLKAREEERQEVARKVEATASDYIRTSREELNRREIRYRRMAYLWYGLAFVSLATGVAFAAWRASRVQGESNWYILAELIVLGVVVVAMIVGLSKLSFSLGKAFMVEALRNADRSHAISFGEFYLRAFGEKAAWSEVKEAFQHWNVESTGSSFGAQSTKEYDPQLLETAVNLLREIKKTEK